MEAYIEYVVVDNLVITAIICAITYRVLGVQKSRLRIACACVFGTLAAVFYPFLSLNAAILLVVKAGVFGVMSLLLFFKRRYFFKGALVFLLITGLMGGLMFMCGYVIYGDAKSALSLPAFDFSIGMMLLLPIFFYFVIRRLVTRVHRLRNINQFCFKIEFCVFERWFKASGFLDSGNMLFDEPSGLPVVVVGGALTGRILSPMQLEMLIKNQCKGICPSAHISRFNTLGKGGSILVIKPQNFRLYLADGTNILKEVMLGLSLKRLGNNFDALLSPSLF